MNDDWLSAYATQTACESIDLESSSNFFRVAVFCLSCGLLLFVLFAAPMCLCNRDAEFDEDAADVDDAPNDPDTWEDAVQEFSLPEPKRDVSFGKDVFDSPVPMRDRSNPNVVPSHLAISKSRSNKSLGSAQPPKLAWQMVRKSKSGQFTEAQVSDPKPNLQAARQHLQQSSPVDHDGKWRCVWGTKIDEIGHIGGPGLELYFRMIQGLGLCFCLMSICTSPLAILSFNGNFVPDFGPFLARATVGNLGMMAPQGLSQENRLIILGCQAMDIKKLTHILSYLDAAAAVVFAVYVAFFRFWILPREAASVDAAVANYSVEIDHLPATIKNQAAYQNLLKDHILGRLIHAREATHHHIKGPEPPCRINEVTVVRDYGKRLARIAKRARLLREADISEYKGDRRKADKLKKRIEKLTLKLKKKLVPEAELPAVRAYLVLHTMRDVRNLLVQYRFANFAVFRCCQSRALRFQGRAIRVRSAPDPTNLIPQNQDVSRCEQRGRSALMFIIWLLALATSSAGIYMIGRTAKQASNVDQGSSSCDSSGISKQGYVCDNALAVTWTKDFARNQTGDILDCYCISAGYHNVMADEELRDDVCRAWLLNASKSIGLGLAASLLTIIVNSVFLCIVFMLANWEQPASVSALNSSIMVKVFGSQFVNTALVVYFVNFKGLFLFNGAYGDFEKGWYAIVGGALSTTLLINTFVPAVFYLAYWLWIAVHRRCTRRRIKHQAELIQLYTNPPFDISYRYAQLLMTCFCTLLYSSGLPLVNFFAALFCFITYWTDKWMLLRGSCRPPSFDVQMPRLASEILLFAAPLHCLAAVAMYSHECTFPSDPLGGTLGDLVRAAADSAHSINHIDLKTGDWMERAFYEATFVHTGLLFISVAFFVFWILCLAFGATFGEALNCFIACCCPQWSLKGAHRKSHTKSRKSADQRVSAQSQLSSATIALPEEVTWDEVEEIIERIAPPASYKLERHPDFEKLSRYLRMDVDASSTTPEGDGETA